MKLFIKILFVLALAVTRHAFGQDPELTNYRSGIDVIWGVGDGSDKRTAYMEEYFFYDKLLDDHKVVYLKDTTYIAMYHNARNVAKTGGSGAAPNYTVGANGPDGLPNSGDEGVIRYRWDRDRQIKGKWAPIYVGDSSRLYPAYSSPFTMASQQYGFGDAVNVVGSTGSNGGPLNNFTTSYYRGTIGPFGDEWHTLAYADDSNQVLAALGITAIDPKDRADDGKHVLIVVNPKTPCFTARVTGTGQFFTTWPKAYWTPRVVAQTTYIAPGSSGTVTIELCDINGNNVFYRIGGSGAFTDAGTATVAIPDTAFADGSNILEYYYAGNAAYTKTRTVVKNPGFPSAGESHGYALFRSPANYDKMVGFMGTYGTLHYSFLNTWKTNSGFGGSNQDSYIPAYRTGRRWASGNGTGEYILKNTVVAKVAGFNYTKAGQPMSYGQAAKAMLLDGCLQSDSVGIDSNTNGDAVPNRERFYRGYYDNTPITDAIMAYDLQISFMRSDQVTGGITPVEDYFIRNNFARYAYEAMMWAQGINDQISPGMWGGAHMLTAGIIACVMPEYSEPLYGTSGIGSANATWYNCPFPDVKYTWAQVLMQPQAHGGPPNVMFGTGLSDNDDTAQSLITFPGQVISGFTMPDNSWIDKLAYTSPGQMGTIFEMYASVVRRLAPAYENTRLLGLIQNAAAGTLLGGKLESGSSYTIATQPPGRNLWINLCNDGWPNVASLSTAYMQSLTPADGTSYTYSSDDKLFGTYSIGLYDSTYYGGADVTAPTLNTKTIPSGGNTIVFTFNEPVTYGAGGSGGFSLTLSGGAVTATYSSGTGSSTLTYSLSRTVSTGETGTFTYTQPGNGIEDTAGNDLASITSTAITIIGAGDTTPPTVSITTPSGNVTVTAPNYTAMAGPAADNTGVQSVLWSNSRGGSGTATGTTSWTIPTITLLSGDNIITVQSRDAAGNLSTAATRTITYNPPSVGGTETHTNPRNRLGF